MVGEEGIIKLQAERFKMSSLQPHEHLVLIIRNQRILCIISPLSPTSILHLPNIIHVWFCMERKDR